MCKKIQSESRNSGKDCLKRRNFYFLASLDEINMGKRFKCFILKNFILLKASNSNLKLVKLNQWKYETLYLK